MRTSIEIGKTASTVALLFGVIVWLIIFFGFSGGDQGFINRLIYASLVAFMGWATVAIFMYSFYWLYEGIKEDE
jgi:hypothetical protein